MEDLYKNMNLDDLYKTRDVVEKRIDDFFGDDEIFNSGDQGYQDLLEDLGNVQDKINELIGYED